jgi:NAD(P)-dependent dehydrogenase (short-subunit alcohol dehydrogenase family)
MPTVLITGASRGIGLEFAKQYAAEGWTVLAAARDPDAVARGLGDARGDFSLVRLDVCDPASVAILSERLRGTPIDLLINNAGLYGPRRPELGAVHYPAWFEVLNTNVMGAMRVTEALVDNIRAGDRKRIAAISSKVGSMADNSSGGGYIYRSSKAAMNAVFRSLAIDLAGEGIRVAILHPGWVRTDMGGANALIDTATSVAGMRDVIAGLTAERSGRFINYDGSEIPW